MPFFLYPSRHFEIFGVISSQYASFNPYVYYRQAIYQIIVMQVSQNLVMNLTLTVMRYTRAGHKGQRTFLTRIFERGYTKIPFGGWISQKIFGISWTGYRQCIVAGLPCPCIPVDCKLSLETNLMNQGTQVGLRSKFKSRGGNVRSIKEGMYSCT